VAGLGGNLIPDEALLTLLAVVHLEVKWILPFLILRLDDKDDLELDPRPQGILHLLKLVLVLNESCRG
jgi:hypothetical protein